MKMVVFNKKDKIAIPLKMFAPRIMVATVGRLNHCEFSALSFDARISVKQTDTAFKL